MLKVGIAGYGVVGKRRRICVDNHPLLKLEAICDRDFKVKVNKKNEVYEYVGTIVTYLSTI